MRSGPSRGRPRGKKEGRRRREGEKSKMGGGANLFHFLGGRGLYLVRKKGVALSLQVRGGEKGEEKRRGGKKGGSSLPS